MTTKAKPFAGKSWYSIEANSATEAHIAIYDAIGLFGVDAAMFKADLAEIGEVDTIHLALHSPGGSVFDGLAIYEQLKAHKATVRVKVEGLAASIASVIAMAGDTIEIPSNAFMMIHKPHMMGVGDAEELRDNADLLDKIQRTMTAIYVGRTGQTEADVTDWLNAETWFNGEEAQLFGFADELSEPVAAAASFQSNEVRFNTMPKGVKDLLNGQQPASAPAAAATPAPASSTNPEPVAQAPTIEDFQAAERARRDDVRAVFAGHEGFESVCNACLDDMSVTADGARKALLDAMGKNKTPSAVQVHVGNGDVTGDSIRNALLAKVRLEDKVKDNPFNGATIMEMAKASLKSQGVSFLGFDQQQIAAAALHHTSDFPAILRDVATKSMLKGYDETEESFTEWTSVGTLTDFRPASRVGLSTMPTLDKVPEGADYTYGTTSDRKEQIVLATYGKILAVTRQMIINDDLGAFTRIPQMMGRAARRTVGDLVYAVLTSNPTMDDGTALFHASHNNIVTGAFGTSVLDDAKVKMALQTDGDATALNIRPAYLVTPVARQSAARTLLAAEYDPAFADQNVPNPIRDMASVVSDARLDAASATTTYMVADPSMHDTIEVAYLDGNSTPFIDSMESFDSDGVKMKVRLDAGVAPLEFRTMVRISDS